MKKNTPQKLGLENIYFMKKFRIRHNKDFHSIVAHVHKYLICGTFYANPIDKLYNYTKMLSLKLTIHECKYFFMNFLRNFEKYLPMYSAVYTY